MSTPRRTDPREIEADVAIAGGGLAGIATALHLARAGLDVVCIEPRPWPRPTVGESLEFSAPQLLADVGIDLADARDRGLLFPKDAVEISSPGETFTLWPPSWFTGPPIRCSRITYHTDRQRLDAEIARLAAGHGTEILAERVTQVEHDGRVVRELITDRGTRVSARWYVDATGHSSRLFGRALGLQVETLGEPRVAYWGRFAARPDGHATRLHFPERWSEDLSWAWEIPLSEREVSIGVVMPASHVARLRSQGFLPNEIFVQQLGCTPRLWRIVTDNPPIGPDATTYTPYRHREAVGANWILVGDASATVDPLTSNGVASALRHAELAAQVVMRSFDRRRVSRRDEWRYRHTAPAVTATVNRAIEAFVYESAIRRRLGLRLAVNLYGATGVVTNALYARIGQSGGLRSGATAAMLSISRIWIRVGRASLARIPGRGCRGGRSGSGKVASDIPPPVIEGRPADDHATQQPRTRAAPGTDRTRRAIRVH